MKIIGLTGNSGSGKSTVSKIFKENKGYIIDADEIAHINMKKGNLSYNEIIEEFGEEILSENKEIDRKKLGEIVFNNKEKLDKLNEISLKHILKTISEEVDKISKNPEGYDFIVIDAPLLIETGLNFIVHEVWLVRADKSILIDRISKRDNIDIEYAKNRLKNQTSQDELAKYANIIIDNNYVSLDELTKNVLSKLNLKM